MNEKKTPMLNGKHLMYIATRKGAIHNKDCAFGLFGRLPFMEAAQDINNLKKTHTMITSESRRRTIYRAILSVDDETAKAHGLYDLATWQELVTNKIGIIAKEMDIDRKDFCWAASMHYSKGHPHVHIMYWDNGSKVRQEYVPDERFEIMAEHVKAEFGREIYAEEISERREHAREIIDETRLELMSLCKEQNVTEALDLNHVTDAALGEIGQRLYDLVLSCPRTGSLKYAFLPENFKKQLDDMITEIMNISDFRKKQKQYLKLTNEVSAFYGNGEEKVEFNRDKALKKLNTAMGNEVMNFIRAYKKELEATAPAELEGLKSVRRSDAQVLLRSNPGYMDLRNMMPRYRTPMYEIMTDEFRQEKDEVVNGIMSDIRVRTKIYAYIKNVKDVQEVPIPTEYEKAENRVLTKETYYPLFRTVDEVVMEALYQDAGYDRQWKEDMAVNMLIQVFGSADQGLNQQRCRHELDKIRSKDKSKTALRDSQKRQEQQGYWEQEW
ncbi:MAG: relaxase MobL [Oscillospiraceae bacterium]|nr:relaxase MobL [Oscillospiraceae bacterium]